MKSIKVQVQDFNGGREIEVAVNNNNEGLFFYLANQGWAQQTGTTQFSAKTPRTLVLKLKKYLDADSVKMVRGSASGF